MNLTSIGGHEPAMPADSKVFKNMVIVNFLLKIHEKNIFNINILKCSKNI
jgi:hypothetical protein